MSEEIYARYSVALGDLIETGFDWGRNKWDSPSIDQELLEGIREKLNEAIEDRFWFRELSMVSPGRWRHHFIRHVSMAMDDLGPLFNVAYEGVDVSGLESSNRETIFSDFPQSELDSRSQDYASSADTTTENKNSSASMLEAIEHFDRFFQSPTNKLLDRLERMFSSQFTY